MANGKKNGNGITKRLAGSDLAKFRASGEKGPSVTKKLLGGQPLPAGEKGMGLTKKLHGR